MGLLHCINTQRPAHILLLLLLLLFRPTAHHHNSAEGRSLHTLPKEIASEKARALIGSRPPICERRCIACGHCEAVQVPVIPQAKKTTTTTTKMTRRRQSMGAVASLRGGDYGSNYKPLSWKCKCGDIIFNP